jgi:hypothetical protein
LKVIPKIYGNKTSTAEQNVFKLIKSLNFTEYSFHNYVVALHSLNLGKHEKKRWSEGDFIILSERGILLLEIKGGRVAYKNNLWEFTDRDGNTTRKIEGPGAQANSAFHSLYKNYLKDYFEDDLKGAAMGFGVVFESITRVVINNISDLPELPDTITAYKKDCLDTKSFKSYLNKLYSHYETKVNASKKFLSEDLINSIVKRLRPEFEKVPGIGYQINDLENQMLSFTEEQYKVYDSIQENQRIMIEGGAGSGKTFLAMAAARYEALLDKKVLLVTRSPFLASHLNASQNLFNIIILDFESLKKHKFEKAFDVLIIDEGQDLCQMLSLDFLDKHLSKGLEKGCWRWFGDPNHQVSPSFPIEPDAFAYLKEIRNSSFKLNENIRNTPNIVKTLEAYTKANVGIAKPKGIGGVFKYEEVDKIEEKFNILFYYLKDWLGNENSAKRSDITILVPNKITINLIVNFLNSKNIRSETISTNTLKVQRDAITISTVEDFKGLDSPIICVWGLNNIKSQSLVQYIYKAFSRANHTLLFIATKEESVNMKELY